MGVTLGYNEAYRAAIMAQQSSQACNCAALHLEVGEPYSVIIEFLEFVDHFRHCKTKSNDTALRGVEALG